MEDLRDTVEDILDDTDVDIAGFLIKPEHVKPIGIGGYIGIHDNPQGDIFGTHLASELQVFVEGDNSAEANERTQELIKEVLGIERKELFQSGIQRIILKDVLLQSDKERQVIFSLLFEHLELPEDTEGIIETVPINLALDHNSFELREIISSGFMDGSLDWFDVIDDPLAGSSTPSNWQYNDAESRIEQLSGIRGGPSSPENPLKPGTYLVLKETPERPLLKNFIMRALVSSDDDDGLGVVFRFQDENNFYFFLMDSDDNYRLLGKKAQGEFQMFEIPALDNLRGYTPGKLHNIEIVVLEKDFRIFFDKKLALAGQDLSITAAGRVGFMSRSNEKAYFHKIELQAF